MGLFDRRRAKALAGRVNCASAAATLGLAALAMTASRPAQAKDFRNSYVAFTLPERWDCEFRDTEFVCRNVNDPQARREAVIILTAKEVGAQDSFKDYELHLKQPRMLPSRTGVPQASKIIPISQSLRKINDQMWVDGMHLSSEVPNYYTRYLATIKEKIAILVTFSAHTSAYARYVQDFFRAISSLRVTVARSEIGNQAGNGGMGLGPGGGGLGGGLGFPDPPPEQDPEASGGSSTGSLLAVFGFFLGAIGLYLLLKSKKKKDRHPTRRY
jgi:hypothetical protein